MNDNNSTVLIVKRIIINIFQYDLCNLHGNESNFSTRFSYLSSDERSLSVSLSKTIIYTFNNS